MATALVLPPPIMTSEPGSFARHTMINRLPGILKQMVSDQNYPADILRDLDALREEIAGSPIKPITEKASDAEFWNQAWAEHAGHTWLDVSWYFAETFFHRRILQATRYFQPGEYQAKDPFLPGKVRQMREDLKVLEESFDDFLGIDPHQAFKLFFYSSLWGNRADLSNKEMFIKPAGGQAVDTEHHLILIDHTSRVLDYLATVVRRVDIITDNVGIDTIYDLALADFLVHQGWAGQVLLHVKNQPFFVSDAMATDIDTTIDLFLSSRKPSVGQLGRRLADARQAQKIDVRTDPFWTTCLGFYKMPTHLREELGKSGLIILKGDANYRRMLDDRHWPFTTRLEAVTPFFPKPFVHLRTMKSEIMVGLQAGEAEGLYRLDPKWQVNNRRGLIHFVDSV